MQNAHAYIHALIHTHMSQPVRIAGQRASRRGCTDSLPEQPTHIHISHCTLQDSVHLAEAAQILYQNTVYEIPALRKIIQTCVRQQQELHRKEAEYNKVSQEYRARYEKECAKLGIKGKDVRRWRKHGVMHVCMLCIHAERYAI
jgi:hypothetical protein